MPRDAVLTRQESRRVHTLSVIYATRMLGLYMVLPVLSPYAATLPGSTSLLIGISLGVYGATQALFQVPFGYMSDRIGRRRTIIIGLFIFFLGSIVAAEAQNAWVLVLGRALQGSGAIASVVMALVADLTREEVRTQAMTRVGSWIGGTFAVSIVIGPTIAGLFGVRALFYLTAIGTAASLVYMGVAVSDPIKIHHDEPIRLADALRILRMPPLLMIDAGIFILHTVVTILFVVLPFDLRRVIDTKFTWVVLVPAILIGLLLMRKVGHWADRGDRTLLLSRVGAGILASACIVLSLNQWSGIAVVAGLFLVVASVAVLEPILASLLSRFSSGPHRGTAAGVYGLAQYVGAFFGGLMGGAFLLQRQSAMFLALSCLCVAWGIGLARARDLHELDHRDRAHGGLDRPL